LIISTFISAFNPLFAQMLFFIAAIEEELSIFVFLSVFSLRAAVVFATDYPPPFAAHAPS